MNGPLTAARWARRMALVGLVCGILYAFGGLVSDLATTGVNRGTALAFLALLGMPLAFGAAGWAFGWLAGLARRGE